MIGKDVDYLQQKFSYYQFREEHYLKTYKENKLKGVKGTRRLLNVVRSIDKLAYL